MSTLGSHTARLRISVSRLGYSVRHQWLQTNTDCEHIYRFGRHPFVYRKPIIVRKLRCVYTFSALFIFSTTGVSTLNSFSVFDDCLNSIPSRERVAQRGRNRAVGAQNCTDEWSIFAQPLGKGRQTPVPMTTPAHRSIGSAFVNRYSVIIT